MRAPSGERSRRDVDLGAVLLDSLEHGSGDVLRTCGCRRPGAARRRCRANMPASRMKPGNTVVTPTPVPRSSSCEREAESAQAELRRAVDGRRRRSRPCPTATRSTRCGRCRARASAAASARASCIGARRLTSSARSISSALKLSSAPGRRQRRVRDQHVDPAPARPAPPPAPGRTGPRPASRRRRRARARARSSTSPLRPLTITVAPRAVQRARDRLPDPARRAGHQRGAVLQLDAHSCLLRSAKK